MNPIDHVERKNKKQFFLRNNLFVLRVHLFYQTIPATNQIQNAKVVVSM